MSVVKTTKRKRNDVESGHHEPQTIGPGHQFVQISTKPSSSRRVALNGQPMSAEDLLEKIQWKKQRLTQYEADAKANQEHLDSNEKELEIANAKLKSTKADISKQCIQIRDPQVAKKPERSFISWWPPRKKMTLPEIRMPLLVRSQSYQWAASRPLRTST
jgi:hypothetical protein